MRQRVSRLVRDTIAFFTKLEDYIGAVKYFICHYNLTKAAALPVQHYPVPCVRSDLPPRRASSRGPRPPHR